MTHGEKIGVVLVVFFLYLLVISAFYALIFKEEKVQAQQPDDRSKTEVAPYKFADLPHGRIYKAVHEGCELFIVETDNDTTMSSGHGFTYSVTAARGCK